MAYRYIFLVSAFLFGASPTSTGHEPEQESKVERTTQNRPLRPVQTDDAADSEDTITSKVVNPNRPKLPGPGNPGTPPPPPDPEEPPQACDRVSYNKTRIEACTLPGNRTGTSTWVVRCWSDSVWDANTNTCVRNEQNEYCDPNPITHTPCQALPETQTPG